MQIDNPALVAEYREQGYCELIRLLAPLDHYAGQIARSLREGPIECNHIWSMGRRPDLWSNLINLHPVLHRWFHETPISGRVACLYAKWLKGGRDWNVEELNFASGRYVIGWLDTRGKDCDPAFEHWRLMMVQHPEGVPSGEF